MVQHWGLRELPSQMGRQVGTTIIEISKNCLCLPMLVLCIHHCSCTQRGVEKLFCVKRQAAVTVVEAAIAPVCGCWVWNFYFLLVTLPTKLCLIKAYTCTYCNTHTCACQHSLKFVVCCHTHAMRLRRAIAGNK